MDTVIHTTRFDINPRRAGDVDLGCLEMVFFTLNPLDARDGLILQTLDQKQKLTPNQVLEGSTYAIMSQLSAHPPLYLVLNRIYNIEADGTTVSIWARAFR